MTPSEIWNNKRIKRIIEILPQTDQYSAKNVSVILIYNNKTLFFPKIKKNSYFRSTCVGTGVLKKYTCMWVYERYGPAYSTLTKFTDTRVTPALKSEKYLALILMRKYI